MDGAARVLTTLAAEAAALTALGESEKAKVSLDAALAARPELDAAFLDRAFPFANEADYGKLASLMMGVFVPAKDTS